MASLFRVQDASTQRGLSTSVATLSYGSLRSILTIKDFGPYKDLVAFTY